jgi:hypothetical protein
LSTIFSLKYSKSPSYETNKGTENIANRHFGLTPMFIICDTGTNTTDTISNLDLGHVHGMCISLWDLDGKFVDSISAVVGLVLLVNKTQWV